MPRFNVDMILAGRYHEWLMSGLVTTVELSIAAFALGLTVGILVTALRSVPFRPAQWVAFVYVEYHRNTPALVQLFFWYFGMPEVLPVRWRQWLYQHNGEFAFAVIGLGLCVSAYVSEDLRSGMRAIPARQHEAARAIGFSFVQAFAYILLPQAIRLTAPALFSRALLTVKNTSLAMAVGVGELIYQARQVEAMTFHAYEAFAFVTVSYLLLTLSLMTVGRWYEHSTPVRT